MKSSRNVIFVGGIHGVGKSTICKKLCSDLGLEYLSASKLISDYKNILSRKIIDVGKLVKDIAQNQDILVRAVKENIELDKKYIIDGHFTLLDSAGDVQAIPLSVFSGLSLAGIVVLIDDPAAIQKRLSLRDGKQFDLELLESMQNQELSHADAVSLMLKIRAVAVSIDNYGEITQIAYETLGVSGN